MALTTMLLLLAAGAAAGAAEAATSTTTTRGCRPSCGGVNIPYPFGVGTGCFRKGFEIECTKDGPVLAGSSLRVKHLSIHPDVSLVMLPIGWKCYNASSPTEAADSSYGETTMNKDGVYRISNTHNMLVVIGCDTMGYTASMKTDGGSASHAYYTGCMSYCNNSASAQDGLCAGVGCCHVDIPPGLTHNYFKFNAYDHSSMMDYSPCDYAFLVDRNNYTFRRSDLKMDTNRTSPVWLDWAIRGNGSISGDILSCNQAARTDEYACVSDHSDCLDSTNGPGYNCRCSDGYQGDAYIVDGCTSAISGILVLALLSFIYVLRKERREARDFFRKNGGLTLKDATSIKIFKMEELKPILKKHNLIGKGAFGEVYKGDVDGVLVAIKKPIGDNALENNQFPNEVIIQSQVIHKNIVRLRGCCLEVDTPMLVYEFISNGSLEDILHKDKSKLLNLDVRLSILQESAHGLSYMHSQTHTTILHGDVKPANILLDENFTPKISDFGISRLIAKDKEQTANIIGDMTYMDPVYLKTGRLTDRSDVYSFGVVILELISRKKATHSDNNSLVCSFQECHQRGGTSLKLFDPEIATAGNFEILDKLAQIAMECLHLDVDQRPSMTDVAERLLILHRSRKL
ncbi:unnamed protein product [Triticum turgidum subsp. durum]|uniref:Protein kinase domain-containing protein n=1 Tax=Triticum turgidum subsp. durum TaxID=4567 RepID=A0A9R0QIU2_TRITD|nr:unnamed protein product [Triticum turgidum subsp. durum]